MIKLYRYLLFFFVIFFFTKLIAFETDWTNDQESQVRLISPVTSNDNSEKIYIGLEYRLIKDWKTLAKFVILLFYKRCPGPRHRSVSDENCFYIFPKTNFEKSWVGDRGRQMFSELSVFILFFHT